MSDSKKDGTPSEKAQKPKQSKRPPIKATHVTQPFLNVRVPKGASKKTVETAVIQALEDKAPTFTNSEDEGSGPRVEASTEQPVNVAAAAEAPAAPGTADGGTGSTDTKFFKDEKDALLMIVNQEGL